MALHDVDRHESSDSLDRLTSISSHASVGTYETLKAEITKVEQSQTSLHDLVNEAEDIINERFAPTSQSTFTVYGRGSETTSVDLAAVMRAMLGCAQECGGEEGRRYVASAVVACGQDGDGVEGLAALGTTWLTHLLFIFKTRRGHETPCSLDSFRSATPTLATHGRDGTGNRQRSFVHDLKARDGYQCLLTRFQDRSHPAPNRSIPIVRLEACHILHWAIGNLNMNQRSDSFKSAVATFDILVNFTRLPLKTLEDLQDHLDDTSNGMMLQKDAHDAFDDFYWCLKKTDHANEYNLKIFENTVNILNKPEGTPIIFRDHSDDFSLGSTPKRTNRLVPLPDPHYIAIHAAVAEILHTSGAGKFFDEILDRYRVGGKVPPVRCWSELERMLEVEQLRESVVESFQSVGVH